MRRSAQFAFALLFITAMAQSGDDDDSKTTPASAEFTPKGTVLARLFGPGSTYNAHEFPTGGGYPVKVTVGIDLWGINDVDLAHNMFTVTLRYTYAYRDDRLAIPEKVRGDRIYLDSKQYNGDILWNPRVVFENIETIVTEKVASNIIYAEAKAATKGYNVRPARLAEMRFSSEMNARKFPFDTQTLAFTMSSYSYKLQDEVKFTFKPATVALETANRVTNLDYTPGHSYVSGRLTCPEEKAQDCVGIKDLTNLSQKKSYDTAQYTIRLTRTLPSAFLNYIVPLQGIWLICYMSFYLDPDGGVDRDALTITALLTSVAYGLEIKPKLPETSYVTLADVYIFFYLAVCLYATLEYLIVRIFYNEGGEYDEMDDALAEDAPLVKDKKQKNLNNTNVKYQAVALDRFSRVCILAVTLIFNIAVTVYVRSG